MIRRALPRLQGASRSSWIRACTASLLGAALAACSGSIGAPGLSGDGTRADQGGLPGADQALPQSTFQPAQVALRKLTVRQYENSVADLLGVDAELPELEPDSSLNGSFSIAAARATLSPTAVEKFETAAYALAKAALDADHRAATVGCSAQDASCREGFLARFGQRAFRRPLSDDERARYAALAREAEAALGGDFYAGLEFAVAAILQSPNFLFRVELGSDLGNGTLAYDDYELATRLSYLLWNTTPDDALLAAAQRGELGQPAGLAAQADRLLAEPRARQALDTFHEERLALDEIELVDKDPGLLPGGLDDELKLAMKNDVLDTIEDYTFGAEADFRTLFTTRTAYVSGPLAELYGLPGSSRGKVVLPADGPRAGLLGKAAFLATYAHADSTSPTRRGKFIRERVLCQSIPAPPPNVSTVLPAPDPSAPTMRQRLASHSEIASCAACHKLMDPLGLSLEGFDAVGRFRRDDQGHALDLTGDLNGSAFDGALELGQLLSEEADAVECVARQLYRYATAHVEGSGEESAVRAAIDAFEASGYRFSALLRAVIASDGFRYGAKP